MSGSDCSTTPGGLVVHRHDPPMSKLNRHCPGSLAPALNPPEQVRAAQLATATYVLATVPPAEQATVLAEYASILGWTDG